MKAVLADTFYYLALLNTRDEAHEVALRATAETDQPMVTTAWVLTEVADALAGLGSRGTFVRLLEDLRTDIAVEIVPATHHLFERGTKLYAERPDKEWSLTDCISFVVMQDRGIADALTGDHHFEQAGFRALLRQ